MSVRSLLKIVMISGTFMGLVACSTTGDETSMLASSDEPLRSIATVSPAMNYEGESLTAEEQALLQKQVVYFDFDRFDINEVSRKVIFAHAKQLLDNPTLKLRIDGHTDERGSREYNIGLGERRANAVARLLALKGVPSDRVVSVSYGKEKPVAFGHTESAWGMNRRAELYYEG